MKTPGSPSTAALLPLLTLGLACAAGSPSDELAAATEVDSSGGDDLAETGLSPDPEQDADEDESLPLAAAPDPTAATVTIEGRLTFVPEYRTTDGTLITSNLGQIPGSNNSYARMRNLFVCAFEQDGSVDFDSVANSVDPFAGNDDLLGCDSADGNGNYRIDLSESSSGYGDDVYLLTWFCDAADFDLSSVTGEDYEDEAEVCVRMNVVPTSHNTDQGRHRKFLRSRRYLNALDWSARNYVNWNLSCPDKDGWAASASYMNCSGAAVEPATTGSTNSINAYNREFAHLFRTSVEPVRSFGSLKPRASAVATVGCGFWQSQPCPVCDDEECHEEINMFVRTATIGALSAVCATGGGNGSSGYNTNCISHGSSGAWGTVNPFRPLHEVGHTLHRRWMVDPGTIEQGVSADWAEVHDESSATAEGYANFVGVASWFPDSSSDPVYDDLYDDHPSRNTVDVESASAISLRGSCGIGTGCDCSEGWLEGSGRPTQFFWDLYDADDWIDLSFWDILRVWSTFPFGTGNAMSNECGPDGRNLEDFRLRYDIMRARPQYDHWPSIDSMMEANCVDRHLDGTTPCG